MTVEGLQAIWVEQVAARLRPNAQGLFIEAVIVSVDRNVVSLRVPHSNLIERARKRSNEVEALLSDLLDRSVRVDVVSGSGADAGDAPASGGNDSPPPAASNETTSSASSKESPAAASSEEAKVQQFLDRFPGSVVVRVDEGTT